MKVICSYCRKIMTDKQPLADTSISHTICPECYGHFKEQWSGTSLEKYLDNFDVPVMIVDSDCRVIAANESATKLTGRSRNEITGLLGGEALECCYARLPEGCGRTVHCETCTVRNLVNQAVQEGKPLMRIPVRVQQEKGVINLKFSAIKIGELIRIMVEQ